MIRYLVDSSALWRIMREQPLRHAWGDIVTAGVVGSCHPQRTEFRRSARTLDEYEQMGEMFDVLYPDVPVPKSSWTWVESAQYRLVRSGAHRAFSVVDLLLCATAAHHGLSLLHDDKDFGIASNHLADVVARHVRDAP